MADLARRLREATCAFGSRGTCGGVGEVDFRHAMRMADLPLTESDTRRIFAHFEVRTTVCAKYGSSVIVTTWEEHHNTYSAEMLNMAYEVL